MGWVIVVALVVATAVAVVIVRARRGQQSGMTSFRRHIDALSPEARREVADRVRRMQHERRSDEAD